MKRFLLLTAVLVVPEAALGQEYKPDFNCAADLSKDSIATMLCQNSEAAKHELIFDQTYYALRQIVGKEGWKALKQEAIADDDVFKACVGPETADGALPRADPYCYISTMDALTQKYRRRLSGSALEEASRPIDQHIALQQKFIDLGYLPAGSVADGVYGEATREAISTWQRVAHRPASDGFISDADAAVLSASTTQNQSYSPPPISQHPVLTQQDEQQIAAENLKAMEYVVGNFQQDAFSLQKCGRQVSMENGYTQDPNIVQLAQARCIVYVQKYINDCASSGQFKPQTCVNAYGTVFGHALTTQEALSAGKGDDTALPQVSDRDVIALERSANEDCRDGMETESLTTFACTRRDYLDKQLSARGWCWGHPGNMDEAEADKSWRLCSGL